MVANRGAQVMFHPHFPRTRTISDSRAGVPHARGENNSAAMKQANVTLDQRDAGPRRYRHSLVSLAPDRTPRKP
jgi:hypothetical protein